MPSIAWLQSKLIFRPNVGRTLMKQRIGFRRRSRDLICRSRIVRVDAKLAHAFGFRCRASAIANENLAAGLTDFNRTAENCG